MIDTLVACLNRLDAEAARTAHGLLERYLVATLHRPFNVDSPEAAALLVKALHQVADEAPVIMPGHPRGRAVFEGAGLAEHAGITVRLQMTAGNVPPYADQHERGTWH